MLAWLGGAAKLKKRKPATRYNVHKRCRRPTPPHQHRVVADADAAAHTDPPPHLLHVAASYDMLMLGGSDICLESFDNSGSRVSLPCPPHHQPAAEQPPPSSLLQVDDPHAAADLVENAAEHHHEDGAVKDEHADRHAAGKSGMHTAAHAPGRPHAAPARSFDLAFLGVL